MKHTDIVNIKTLIAEYGSSPGASTPVSQQASASSAKASAASRLSTSSINKPQQSPTSQQVKPTNAPAKVAPVVSKAKELAQDFEFSDDKGNVQKVVSPVNTGLNKDAVIVQNQQSKEFYTLNPDDDVTLPGEEVDESNALSILSSTKKKHRLSKKIKKLTRHLKIREQGTEQIFEINFNSVGLAKSALNAPIKCGFEAETVWLNVSDDDEDADWLDDMNWNHIEDMILDQIGQRSVDKIQEAYHVWIGDSEAFYDIENDIIQELVNERKEDEDFVNRYVDNSVSMDDVDEYKEMIMSDLSIDADSEEAQEEIEERNLWDEAAWAREYVEVNEADAFEEWLIDDIRDNSDAWEQTWERATDQIDIDEWMLQEHGNWATLLSYHDVYLTNEDDTGPAMDAVALQIENWASNNSFSNDVRAGSYHSGNSVDNTYWRVEEDSSIEGNGAGAEIISPVYESPADMLNEMKSLFEFLAGQDVETNTSTGLHVTMSWGGSDDQPVNKLKIAMLLGDKYVLKQFDRADNNYTASQQQKIQDYASSVKNDIKDEKSLKNLEDIISVGINAGKFSSINFKDAENKMGNKLIEFRIAGGEDYHQMIDKIIKAVVRYSAVMQAGHDTEAYKQDYIKALFRMISGNEKLSPDVQQQAQQMVNPESMNTRVLDVFQAVASKKHYTDSIEALNTAYEALAKSNTAKQNSAQQELPFEAASDDEGDWQEQLRQAQGRFTNAFTMLVSDIVSKANRAPVKAAQVGALRQAIADFQLNSNQLWAGVIDSEFYNRFPGDAHSKSDKFAAAFNSMLKVNTATSINAAFTVNFNPETQIIFMPLSIALAITDQTVGVNMIRKLTTTEMPEKITPAMFKVINKKAVQDVRTARYESETAVGQMERASSDVDHVTKDIRELSADTTMDANDKQDKLTVLKGRLSDRRKALNAATAEQAKWQAQVDVFLKTYGFVPGSVRYGSAPIGEEWESIPSAGPDWLSKNHNIKFAGPSNESRINKNMNNVFGKFDKLPLLKQLSLLENIDGKKLDAVIRKLSEEDSNFNESVSKYTPFSIQNKNRKPSLSQSKLSGDEYQRVKKLKAFNKDDWKWDSTQALYVKVEEAYQNDESNRMYMYDANAERIKQKMIDNLDEPKAKAAGYKETPELALKAAGIMRSKFDPKKFVQNQSGKWVTVYPYGKPGTPEGSIEEAKGLGKRVKVVKGQFAGEEGTIREIKHGAFKGAPKSYYIDLDNGEMADNLPADVLRLIKRVEEGSSWTTGSWVVYNGSKIARFKTHKGATAYAEKNGGKVASSEFYHDNIQKKTMAEGAVPDNSPSRKIQQLLNVPLLANDLKAQMEAYFVVPDPSMLKSFRQARASGGDTTDLRSIFKGFITNKVHPHIKQQAGLTESVLNEYTSKILEKEGALLKYGSTRGHMGEYLLGAAVVAKFIAGADDITADDVTAVMMQTSATDSLSYTFSGAEQDNIEFVNIISNKKNIADAKDATALIDAMQSELQGAVKFANSDIYATKWARIFAKNGKADRILVKAAGEEDQSGTKADIILYYKQPDGSERKIKGWSLKTGSNLIGQASPLKFENMQVFFKEIGVDLTPIKDYELNPEKHVVSIMTQVSTELNKLTAGNNTSNEATLVQRITSFMDEHLTKKDPRVYIVNLGKGDYSAQTMNKMRKNLESVNLETSLKLGGRPSLYIHETGNQKNYLFMIRYTYSSGSKSNNFRPRHRMFVETGPLFKVLATISVKDIEQEPAAKPMPAKAPAAKPAKIKQTQEPSSNKSTQPDPYQIAKAELLNRIT